MTTDGMARFERRLDRCGAELAATGADGLVCFPGPNLRYLTGYEGAPSERHLLLFIAEDGVAFIAPALEVSALRAATPVERIYAWADGEDPLEVMQAVTAELGLSAGRILVDDTLWATFSLDLREVLPAAEFGLASQAIEPLRVTKDPAEIADLREAASRSDAVSRELRALGEEVIGMTEHELATDLRGRLYDRSPEGPSFEPVVASGPNGARPHHRHGERTIGEGDPVVLDFGVWVNGYAGDQTRTVVFAGDPPDDFEQAHAAVTEALEAGIEAVAPGVSASAIDRATRAVIEDAGFGDEFIHRTGHGVGLEVHEPPYIVEGNDRPVEPGMVFSVEPGIYLEGSWGVRVEDLVHVTEDGAERLNDSPRGWAAIDP